MALRIGNTTEAMSQMEELSKNKTVPQIYKHFTSTITAPFTHSSRAFEAQFRSTLTDEQKKTYEQAIKDRVEVAKKAIELLKEFQSKKQQNP